MHQAQIRTAFSNAYLLLTLTALFWAGNFVIGRSVSGHVPPIALAFFRWSLAFLFVLPFAYSRLVKDWHNIKSNIPILVLLGTIGVGCFNSLSYIGLNHTAAVNALVLQSSSPILIAVAGFIIFRDHFERQQLAGIFISTLGVLIILSRGDFTLLSNLTPNVGDTLILLAILCWAIYTALLRKRPPIHWLSFAAVTFFTGAVVNIPFYLWEHFSGNTLQATQTTFLAIAYVSIFPSIIAYIFFNRGVELIGSNRAGVFLHLVPFFGTIMSIMLLGEIFQLFHLMGLMLILAGVWITSKSR